MAALVVALRGRLLAAPVLKRTHPHRRREGRANEKDLLVQSPINGDKDTKKGYDEGNRQDRGHIVTQ